jgi:hypothetical protein
MVRVKGRGGESDDDDQTALVKKNVAAVRGTERWRFPGFVLLLYTHETSLRFTDFSYGLPQLFR